MNENDSLQLSALLENELNMELSENIENADVIIINTCSVREKPENKVFSEAGRLAKLKKKKDSIIGIMGCVAQEYGDKILKRASYVDFVVGTHNIHKVPEIILTLLKERNKISITEFYDKIPSLSFFTKPYDKSGKKAFVSIMQGCNNFCSYCIVPFVRGREYSRPYKEILEEISYLVSKGVKEVTLLGQNVNSYGKTLNEGVDFTELLRKIADFKGLERIRFTTSHPKDFNKELVHVMKSSKKICNHLHLPLQSGSNKILKLMNRKYTKEEYLEKVSYLKEEIPEIKLTTDLIVGFPHEEDSDFEETMEMVEKVRFLTSFSFAYSPRPFTKFFKTDNVPYHIKSERLRILQKLQKRITLEHNRAMVGSVAEVFAEGKSKKNSEELTGRLEDNRIVNFTGSEELIGHFVNVKITEGFQNSLKGEINAEYF